MIHQLDDRIYVDVSLPGPPGVMEMRRVTFEEAVEMLREGLAL